jgi:hypothetical protein
MRIRTRDPGSFVPWIRDLFDPVSGIPDPQHWFEAQNCCRKNISLGIQLLFKKISIPGLFFDRKFKLHPTPTYYHCLELISTFQHSQSRICIEEIKIIIFWVYGY